jgi:hypothetical protein
MKKRINEIKQNEKIDLPSKEDLEKWALEIANSSSDLPHYLERKTFNILSNEIENILNRHAIPLNPFIEKLDGYRYVDEIHELFRGKYIRWIRIKNKTPSLTNGAMVMDIKFMEEFKLVTKQISSLDYIKAENKKTLVRGFWITTFIFFVSEYYTEKAKEKNKVENLDLVVRIISSLYSMVQTKRDEINITDCKPAYKWISVTHNNIIRRTTNPVEGENILHYVEGTSSRRDFRNISSSIQGRGSKIVKKVMIKKKIHVGIQYPEQISQECTLTVLKSYDFIFMF